MICTLALALGSLFAASLAAPQATIRVPQDQPTIQQGIDAAAPGDEVLVATGTYTGPLNRNLNCHGKSIEVRGEGGAAATIIDCQKAGRGFVFFTGETNATLVTGFTITHGFDGGAPEGGGGMLILAASPTIRDCIFQENTATGQFPGNGGGGGIGGFFSSAIIDQCSFTNNTSIGDGATGGGLSAHGANMTVSRSTFTGNEAITTGLALAEGGGMVNTGPGSGAPTVVDCIFSGNKAQYGGGLSAGWPGMTISGTEFRNNTASTFHGGGAAILVATVTDCRFIDNVAADLGGGLQVNLSSTVSRCLIEGNVAGGSGGGIWCRNSPSTLTDCVIIGNTAASGGGYSQFDEHFLVRCTLSGNSAPVGSNAYVVGSAQFSQCIISFGVGGRGIQCGVSGVELECSNVYGNQGGDWVGCITSQQGINHNFSMDPFYCDEANGDLNLCSDSPCAPAQQPDCGQVGALPVGCGACGVTSVTETTWGAVKSLYVR